LIFIVCAVKNAPQPIIDAINKMKTVPVKQNRNIDMPIKKIPQTISRVLDISINLNLTLFI
ncbi:hypothetical protein, partial [Escherichia coli]|uniref:hypothetical protein n=1 Tax=Escherichia coli TaxID=562 RepID=UPI00374791A8